MKVLLVNIDSKIQNLALEKLCVYHKLCGDTVVKIKDKSILPFLDVYDKVYVSCVFDYNKHRCKKWEGIAEIGGSGYDLKKRLPFSVEKIKPKINLGFTTRGCIRKCSFCIVPKKEGKIHVVGDIYDLWDRHTRDILLLDNNILALQEHFFKICRQLKGEHLRVDFNQGLDHRLLTDRICMELLSLTYSSQEIRFAFDHILYKNSVLKALKMLKRHGLKKRRSRWYVYVGVYDTLQTVLERIDILRKAGQLIFVMLDSDESVQNNPKFREIYTWGCSVSIYTQVSFEDFCKLPKRMNKRPTLF